MVTEIMRTHQNRPVGGREIPLDPFKPERLRVALFAKYPEPGRVKTRLASKVGAQAAAELHRRLVEKTLDTIRQCGLPFEIRMDGGSVAEWRSWLGADFILVPQGEGDLGARLARTKPPVILLGADIPDLRPAYLSAAAEALARAKVVIGPAEDGGYNLLGLAEELPFMFDAMPWSTDRLYAETRERCMARNVSVEVLETLADLDRPEDLLRWPDLLA